ncbi:MAG: hypothetical protein AAGK22_22055 [Acidobacteriota bacterium]
MRPIETVVLLLLLATTAAVVLGLRLSRVGWLLAGGLSTVLLGVALEGARWQMLPAIVLLLCGLSTLLLRARSQETKEAGTVRKLLAGTVRFLMLPLLVAVAVYLPWAMTVPSIPAPSGPFGVGTLDLAVRWPDRPEELTADTSDVREIAVRAWYPTDGEPDATGDPYMSPDESRAFGEVIGAAAPGGNLLYSHAHLGKTHGHRDATPAAVDAPFPVLAFSHGYTSFLAQNTPLMEELASHGFVVFSLAHTWDGSSVFPEGRITGLGPHVTAWNERLAGDPDAVQETLGQVERLVRSDQPEERRQALEEQIKQARRDRAEQLGVGASWDVWVEDRRRFFDVLEELAAGTRPSPFAGRLDLERIGLLGMSFGGATAAEACHVEPRCNAAVNIDGGHMYGPDSELLDGDIRVPLLMIHSEDLVTHPAHGEADDYRSYSDFHYESPATRGRRRDVVRLRVAGTSHLHLTDMSLLNRSLPGISSRTPGRRIAEILNRHILDFFDLHLRGRPTSLLEGPSPEFPEVSFQRLGVNPSERILNGPTQTADPNAAEEERPTAGRAQPDGE